MHFRNIFKRYGYPDPKRPKPLLSIGSLIFWASLTNVLMFPFWDWLFQLSTPLDPEFIQAFNSAERHRHHLGAGLISLATLSVCFWGFFFIAQRKFRRISEVIADILVLTTLLITANCVRTSYLQILSFDDVMEWPGWVRLGAVGFAALILSVSFFWVRKISYDLIWVATPLVFLILINLGYGIYTLAPVSTAFFSNPELKQLNDTPKTSDSRVLLLIFDELDQRLAFGSRPPGIDLPTFDAIYESSFVALNARPPASFTWASVPSMIVGEKVEGFTESRRAENLGVRYKKQKDKQIQVSQIGTVFSDASDLGMNTAVFSHHAFQFCDMFYESVSLCWHRHGWASDESNTVFARIPRIFDRIVTFIPLFERIVFGAPRPGYFTRENYVDGVKKLIDDMSDTVADPAYEFVFAHINVPHDPFVYDAAKNEFANSLSSNTGYLGNLELADRILSRIDRAMKVANLWDRTTIVITSDHWWRDNTYDGIVDTGRVPFIVKLAGQHRQFAFADEIETVGIRNLVRSLLGGSLKTPEKIPQVMIGK